jgi:predicted RNA-binding Zn-ribbon protein involved in translation (DUF1610 family)
MMDAQMLDGNAIGGLLTEVFAVEATTAIETCGACGAEAPIGAVHVFRGAGVVLRCPSCGNTLGTIVKNGERVWVNLRGMRTLELGT